MGKVSVLCVAVMLLAFPAFAQDFKDVPKDHWAAEAVCKLASDEIVKGYPDGTYRGDRPVTRYELAVALERFVVFMQESRKPLAKPAQAPSVPREKTSADPASSLKGGGYLPPDSPLLKDRDKPVTFDQLAQALTSVAARLVELDIPPGENKQPAEN